MRFKLTINNPSIEWSDFKDIIASGDFGKLKSCNKKSKRRAGFKPLILD